MKTGFEHKGIDELYSKLAIAERHNNWNMVRAIREELKKRDIDAYEDQRAESGF